MYRENNPPKKPLGTDFRKYILYAPLNCRLLFRGGGVFKTRRGCSWGTLRIPDGKIGEP